jgi:uncharacterized protein (TIGR02453 family)
VTLAYTEPAADRSAALRREWAIKQLSHGEKEAMITRRQPPAVGPRAGAGFAGFRPAALRFLRELRSRNTRTWFESNRAIYEREVKAPFLALIEDLDVALARTAPEIVGDPRRSMFRIHRDVRFSRDKSPYKTHAACWFYHMDAGRGVGSEAEGGAGFYFQLAPGDCVLGAGVWMPPRGSLAKLRQALVDDQEGFETIVLGRRLGRRFGTLDQEAMLSRLPRGYSPDHPAARWLRYQSFTLGRSLSEREAVSPRLRQILARDFAMLTPFVRWLNRALGFRALDRRV